MMQDYSLACAYVAALTGLNPDVARMSFRCIHDSDKTVPAHSYDGTLPQCWETLLSYQARGYGIFVNINELDGLGRELQNVAAIRAHVVDLDNLSAHQNYERAASAQPAPTMAVQSSPGRYHVYWCVTPYRDNDRYTLTQRKLRQFYDGDKSVIDPTRVLRLPGTVNLKRDTPHLVTVWALPGYGFQHDVSAIEAAVEHVQVTAGGGGRHDLGEPSLAAPSWEWCQRALELADPNDMDRGEWIGFLAAFKQASSTLVAPEVAWTAFSKWCERYTRGAGNDPGENLKHWNSIRNTELGWRSILARIPSLKAEMHFGGREKSTPQLPTPQLQQMDCAGEYLTHLEQQVWFAGCVAVESKGAILTPTGRFMGPSQFNLRYGGKQFVISSTGKTTDEAWKAATRSTLWTVPKVDHVRFLPDQPQGAIVYDQLGRAGVNTYVPTNIRTVVGDVSPFTNHIELMLPNETDRNILYAYLAHVLKFPGAKIRWAPMIQSTEGVGKGFISEAMETIIGEMYCYSPKAQELVKSGSTFNAWMRAKLLIVVNEIKVDERRELIEILKPMITDKRVEIQSKGVDQEMEDNPANWIFFSNFKDAIPVYQNGRRYAIFYSAIQSAADLTARGMNDQYFARLFAWLRADGAAIIAEWLLRHPITVETMPGRAPHTSCMSEARAISMGPIERAILEAVEDQIQGFRGGWVSTVAVTNRLRLTGVLTRPVSQQTIASVLESAGYHLCGRAHRMYPVESMDLRTTLYHIVGVMPVEDYPKAQGY